MRKAITLNQFTVALEAGHAAIRSLKKVDNIIIMGAVELYFEHSKQISYLNKALDYAQSFRGYRKEACKNFLATFSGAKFDKDTKVFTKGGKIKVANDEFNNMDSWLDWADLNHAEKAFDPESIVKRLHGMVGYINKTVKEHDGDILPSVLSSMDDISKHITEQLKALEIKLPVEKAEAMLNARDEVDAMMQQEVGGGDVVEPAQDVVDAEIADLIAQEQAVA